MKFGRSIPSRTLPFFGGSLLEDVGTGTPDHTSLQCECQSLLVHETASGRVDENGVTTHHRQLFRADHVASLLREGDMKGDDVAFLKNGEKVHEPWLRNNIGRQHL